MRQTRVNPPRSSVPVARSTPGARNAPLGADADSGPVHPPAFFPAITHFTDSITALPKEVVRHFTLLKEVDAKACGPEETLTQLTDLAMRTPIPQRKPLATNKPLREVVGSGVDPDTATDPPISEPVLPGAQPANATTDATQAYAVDEASDTTRRHVFLNLRYVVSEMLMTLDEKNHVISTANDALNKQLARLDSSFPYIENEISEEARLGSLTHWAYIDKSSGKTNGNQAGNERSRRDLVAANSLAAAAAAMTEEATASRSESRREAMQARRNRNQPIDSDFDDPHHGRAGDGRTVSGASAAQTTKKGTGHAKVRKTADPGAGNTGLGITNGATTGMSNPPAKRRKTEKAANGEGTGAVAMERSISNALGANGATGKGKAGSPRETPAAEGGRKRARGGGGAGVNAAAPMAPARKR